MSKHVAIVTIDAQGKRIVWAFENASLVWPALADYVRKHWKRVWREQPEEFGTEEVLEYFKQLRGMEAYLISDVPMKFGPGKFLSVVTDLVIDAASTAMIVHIVAEAAQGRADNAVAHLWYVALMLVARFGARIRGGSK